MSKGKGLLDLATGVVNVGRRIIGSSPSSAEKKAALAVIRRGENLAEGQTVKGAVNAYKNTARAAAKAEKIKYKAVNPSYLSTLSPWTKLGGLGVAGGLGFMGISKFAGRSDAPEYDWAGQLNLPTPGAITTTEQNAMDDWLAKRTQAVKDAFSYTPTVPGSEMYNGMSAANNQLGAASMAAMNDLANQYGQGAAAIKDRGVTAGQSINDIYGSGAGVLEALGAQASSEYDSMIPVSGEAAVAPGQQRMAGQSLANYLTQNQLIDAQAQGGMAQLAQMLGPAYANQYALMDVQARAAADANKARTMAEYENDRQSQLAQALGELNMSAADAEYERRVKAAQAGSFPTPDPATLNEMAAQWDALPQEDKTYYSAMAVKNGFEGGIQDAYDWVNYQLEQQQQQLGL